MRRPPLATALQGMFLLYGFAVAIFFPFLALYLRDFQHLDEGEIGFVLAIAAAARMLTNPVWGHVADTRLGRLSVLQIGLVGAAVAAGVMNLVTGLTAVVVVMAVHSVFFVAQGPNLDAIVLEHLGRDRMSEYGRIRGWESMTYAAGCLLFGALLQHAGIRWAMPICAITMLLVLAWTVTLERDRPQVLEDHGRLGAVGAVFRAAPRLWGFLAAALLVWTGFNAAWYFIGPRIEDAGGGPLLIGLGAALGGLIEVPTMRSSPRLQRRLGLRTVYVAGCLVYGTAFLLWGAVSNPTLLSMITVLEGVGFSLLFTTSVVIVGRLVPPSLYSTGNSISQMVWFGLGPILGAGLGGLVYQRLGAPRLYLGAFLLAVAGAIVAWFALAVPSLEEPEADTTEAQSV
jgi:PPP family 3-phenylpropionic acid transporter